MNKTNPADQPTAKPLSGRSESFDALSELALDLRWSWNHATDELWRQLDPALWELTQNPWVVLQTVSPDKLTGLMATEGFRRKLDELLRVKRQAAESPAWFQKNHATALLTGVAYFSLEFMLSEALPIYSGGLGNVAGDQLKTASDLGVPVVVVGLLYQQGYFRQMIDREGGQEALYPYNDPGQLPVTPLRQANGEWLRLEIALPGYSVWLRAWQVQVGRVKLYLLDSNDAANFPVHRGITSELYGGGPELRLKQEMLLGIGGWRLLAALGIRPEICHLNEGHAAFAALERARSFMVEHRQPFAVALAATRAGNLFTTHTAVAAGFDSFSPALCDQYLRGYAENKLGIAMHDFLALGRQNPADPAEGFNMAWLALRTCGSVNGVSRLHGQVSRHLFEPLFPQWPAQEVPVGHVTNGVHMPTWDSAGADALWTKACGQNRWRGTTENLEQDIRRVSDAELWQMRIDARTALVTYARQRLARQLAASGAPAEMVQGVASLFDPNTLTLGFARRFATYKRPNLLLQDPERLLRLLTNARRPVQLILAGKAHPADLAGQALIQEWIRFIRGSEARLRVIFLSDYDMHLTARLVRGVDVWINTPRRPWEACGTSGMKVLVNGGINLSELDGWWAEAYAADLGWAIGDGKEHGTDPGWDKAEGEMLYVELEQAIIPEFYDRDATDTPRAWIARIRESMACLTPRFSADRTVREYTEQHYLPAAAEYRARAENQGARARQIVDWRRKMEVQWGRLHFGALKSETRNGQHVIEIPVFLGDLDPQTVRVELYADGGQAVPPVRQEMTRLGPAANLSGGQIYSATVSADRRASEFTTRVMPYFAGVAVPLEESRICWQK